MAIAPAVKHKCRVYKGISGRWLWHCNDCEPTVTSAWMMWWFAVSSAIGHFQDHNA